MTCSRFDRHDSSDVSHIKHIFFLLNETSQVKWWWRSLKGHQPYPCIIDMIVTFSSKSSEVLVLLTIQLVQIASYISNKLANKHLLCYYLYMITVWQNSTPYERVFFFFNKPEYSYNSNVNTSKKIGKQTIPQWSRNKIGISPRHFSWVLYNKGGHPINYRINFMVNMMNNQKSSSL